MRRDSIPYPLVEKRDTSCYEGMLTLPVLAKPCNRVISKKAMIGNMMAVRALIGSQYSFRTSTDKSQMHGVS